MSVRINAIMSAKSSKTHPRRAGAPPHKVTYYLERRDPNFLSKMKDVLLVYQEVALQNEVILLKPTHGSWLNIVETLFGKMTRTFLRQILLP
jgi:hypothetical protein